ncbi:MAG: hypothetical protein Q4D93_01565 [Porphyromonas sp.]|nr:hypothetical protein [Porphyromonas sp.]
MSYERYEPTSLIGLFFFGLLLLLPAAEHYISDKINASPVLYTIFSIINVLILLFVVFWIVRYLYRSIRKLLTNRRQRRL